MTIQIYHNNLNRFYAIKVIDSVPYIATRLGWQSTYESSLADTAYYLTIEALEEMLSEIKDKKITRQIIL